MPTTGFEIEKKFWYSERHLVSCFIFSNVEKEEAVACLRAL
jgi:hypothetical protein